MDSGDTITAPESNVAPTAPVNRRPLLRRPALPPMPGVFPVLAAPLGSILLLLVAGLFWAIATPLGPLGAWRAPAAEVIPPATRIALLSSFDPFNRAPGQTVGEATVTSLQLTLFGVRVDEATGGGSAIIGGADGVQDSYGVGEEIQPGVKLFGVAFDHVVIDRSGTKESLFLDQSVPAETGAPAAVGGAAPPAPAPAAALSVASLRAGVSLNPRSEGGRVTGMTVQPQGDGAAFRTAGLRPGDVVRAVNGTPIASAADLVGQIRPGARLSLQVERGAETVPINIFLPDGPQ